MSKQQPAKASGKASQSKGSQGKKDGEDLNSVLDAQQRADLTLLVANCTESMRKVLVDNFDATAGLDKSFLQEGMSDDQKMMNADPKADVSKFEAEKKLKQENEKDLATLKMKNLKKNSLKGYDGWREQVLMRIGEVVNSQSTAKEQLEKKAGSNQAKPTAPTTVGKITDVPKKNPNLKFKDLFPPTKTPLTKLPMNKRTLVLHSILLLLISLEHYNAYSRILMLNICSSFKLPLKTFEQDEYTTAKGLLESARELTADEETKKKQEDNKENRTYRVRVATAAGAAILGIAGGMAAPLVAAGVGSVMGGLGLGATAAAGYLGSVAGSTLLVGGLFGAYGGRMTGQMMDKYAREVEDFEFLPVHSRNKTSEDQTEGAKQASEHDHKLRVTICISGWLTEKEEVVKPWRVLGTGAEVFALKYELETLLNLGHAMDGMVTSAAWGYAQKELVGRTIFAELIGAMWPIGLLKVARVLDNPFSVAKSRADKAGEVLADALINKAQGERPVTLIGYSLGARLIYTCLMSLAKRKAFGLVENAVLIGAPTPSDTSDWRVLRTAVSGRLVNVYSQNDYLLGFMYRSSSLQYGVAGLQPVRALAAIENVDVSEDVDGHLRYRFLIGGILKKIGFEDVDMAAVEEEREALEKIKQKEKKESLQAQRNRLMRRKSTQGKESEEQEAEHEASDMEKNVQKATEKSLTTRVIEYFYAPKVPNTNDAEKVAKTLQRAVNNPADAKAALDDTVSDVQNSTYTQYVIAHLPSMPGGSSTSAAKKAPADPAKATDQATKAAGDATKTGQSYVQQASSYLPSLSGGGKSSTPDVKKAATDSSKTAQDATKTVTDAAKDPSKAAGDATKSVTDATKDPSKTAQAAAKPVTDAAKDPSKAAEDATKSVNDAAKNAQSYTQKATSYLPSISSVTGKSSAPDAKKTAKDTPKATDEASEKTEDAKKETQSYTQKASGYLPSWGKKEEPKPKGAAEGAADKAKNVAGTGAEGVKNAAGATKDVVQPTVNNALNPQDNPAVKAGKDTIKNAPVIHQASDRIPGANKGAEVASDTVGTTVKNTTGLLSNTLNSTASKGADAGKAAGTKATDAASDAAIKTGVKSPPPKPEGYLSKASGYMPSWGSSKKSAPKAEEKEEKKPSESKESAKPELKKTDSGAVPKRPDLEKTASGMKSPPKLGSRKNSEMKSPPPKLNRLPSGMKSPPALERLPSGVKSPPANAAKKLSETAQQPMKAGSDAAGKATKGGQDAVKAGGDAAGKATKGGQDAVKAGADTARKAPKKLSEAAQQPTKAGSDAVKAGGDAAGKAAKGGQDAAGKAVKGGQDAAKAGGDAAGKAAKGGQDAAGKAVKGGQDAAKAGGDAAGKVAKGGSDAVKQGGGYLGSAGSAVTGKLPGWGSK